MDRSKKSNKNNKKFEHLKNLPCPFHKNAKHTLSSVDNSRSSSFMPRVTRARVSLITTRMEMTTLI